MNTERITYTLRNLGSFASGIIPSQLSQHDFEPTRDDARAFVNDLTLLAAKVDTVIEAYGEYLQAHGIVSERDVRDCFKDVLLKAIDGNATFCIENGIEQRIEAMRDEYA